MGSPPTRAPMRPLPMGRPSRRTFASPAGDGYQSVSLRGPAGEAGTALDRSTAAQALKAGIPTRGSSPIMPPTFRKRRRAADVESSSCPMGAPLIDQLRFPPRTDSLQTQSIICTTHSTLSGDPGHVKGTSCIKLSHGMEYVIASQMRHRNKHISTFYPIDDCDHPFRYG